jgi:hypothetical protein
VEAAFGDRASAAGGPHGLHDPHGDPAQATPGPGDAARHAAGPASGTGTSGHGTGTSTPGTITAGPGSGAGGTQNGGQDTTSHATQTSQSVQAAHDTVPFHDTATGHDTNITGHDTNVQLINVDYHAAPGTFGTDALGTGTLGTDSHYADTSLDNHSSFSADTGPHYTLEDPGAEYEHALNDWTFAYGAEYAGYDTSDDPYDAGHLSTDTDYYA